MNNRKFSCLFIRLSDDLLKISSVRLDRKSVRYIRQCKFIYIFCNLSAFDRSNNLVKCLTLRRLRLIIGICSHFQNTDVVISVLSFNVNLKIKVRHLEALHINRRLKNVLYICHIACLAAFCRFRVADLNRMLCSCRICINKIKGLHIRRHRRHVSSMKIKIQLFYKRHLRKCYRYRLLTCFRIIRSPARLVVAVFNIRNRKRRCLCRRRFRRNACCIHMILILCRFDIGLLSVNFYFAKSDIAPEIIRSSIRLVHCDLNCSHNFLRVLCHCDRLL